MSTDLDELLKLLEEAVDKKETEVIVQKEIDCEVVRFIDRKHVVKGIDRIPNYVIFFTYMTKHRLPLAKVKYSRINFFRKFNKEFDQVRTGRQRSYMLDEKSFDMSREGLIEARAFNDQHSLEIGIRTGKIKQKRRYVKKENKEKHD